MIALIMLAAAFGGKDFIIASGLTVVAVLASVTALA